MEGGWSPEPAPALKDTAPARSCPARRPPVSPAVPTERGWLRGLPGCPSDGQDGRSAVRTFGLPRARAAPRADTKSPRVGGTAQQGR